MGAFEDRLADGYRQKSLTDLETIKELHRECKPRKCLYYGNFLPCHVRILLDAQEKGM